MPRKFDVPFYFDAEYERRLDRILLDISVAFPLPKLPISLHGQHAWKLDDRLAQHHENAYSVLRSEDPDKVAGMEFGHFIAPAVDPELMSALLPFVLPRMIDVYPDRYSPAEQGYDIMAFDTLLALRGPKFRLLHPSEVEIAQESEGDYWRRFENFNLKQLRTISEVMRLMSERLRGEEDQIFQRVPSFWQCLPPLHQDL